MCAQAGDNTADGAQGCEHHENPSKRHRLLLSAPHAHPRWSMFPEHHLHRKLSLIMANQGAEYAANQSRKARWKKKLGQTHALVDERPQRQLWHRVLNGATRAHHAPSSRNGKIAPAVASGNSS